MSSEVKKETLAPSRVDGKRMVAFFGEVKQEFKIVSWTPKRELITCTKIVVGSTFLFGMFIYIVDLLIQGSLQTLGFFAKLLGG